MASLGPAAGGSGASGIGVARATWAATWLGVSAAPGTKLAALVAGRGPKCKAPVPVFIASGVIGGGNPPVTSVGPPVAAGGAGRAAVTLTLADAAVCEELAPTVFATWGVVFDPVAPPLPDAVWEEPAGA